MIDGKKFFDDKDDDELFFFGIVDPGKTFSFISS